MSINYKQFKLGHDSFINFVEENSNGEPFTSFQHSYMLKYEVSYKFAIYNKAINILQLNKWNTFAKNPGKIIDTLKQVCSPSVSYNLLEHRYGPDKSSESCLYKVSNVPQIREIEALFSDLFLGGPLGPESYGKRFDSLADYLRSNQLGCKWAFMAYLAFLSDPNRYFPILPSKFDKLLNYYGINESISGSISWDRYTILLDLTEELKSLLLMYGTTNVIEIQSYMWVVAGLISKNQILEKYSNDAPNFNEEFLKRLNNAQEKERIGLMGEKFIYEQERKYLISHGKRDLAERVQLVSTISSNIGYDILSFGLKGQENHIEVKSTTRSELNDFGFWISENERQVAKKDKYWNIYRVWNIDSTPSYQNLGNIILIKSNDWELNASTWKATLERN